MRNGGNCYVCNLNIKLFMQSLCGVPRRFDCWDHCVYGPGHWANYSLGFNIVTQLSEDVRTGAGHVIHLKINLQYDVPLNVLVTIKSVL